MQVAQSQVSRFLFLEPQTANVASLDFVGSTAQMQDYVLEERPEKVLMVTECSMSDNVSAGVHDVEFIRPCNLCPHMKKISLANIQSSLETLSPAVEIDPAIADRARAAVERMLDVGRSKMTEVAA